MLKNFLIQYLVSVILLSCSYVQANSNEGVEGLPLYHWDEVWHGRVLENFGDIIAHKLVERIVGCPLRAFKKGQKPPEKKLLAVGSLLYFATEGDVLWELELTTKKQTEKASSSKTWTFELSEAL